VNYRFNPYTIGRPVEGQDFYGREALLNKIRSQRTSVVHLVGMRRIGKTSILKKLAAMEKAVFVDLQAVSDWDDFAAVLQDEIEAEQGRFPWLLPIIELLRQSPDLFSLLRQLDNYFYRANDYLWLLLDETEVLIELGETDIRALRKFQSFLRHMRALRIVFASAKRLIELHELTARPGYGSPFLSEFPPPIYISGLENKAARMLIRQSQNSPQLSVPDDLVEMICRRTNNHPYFIQWICYHLYEKTLDVAAWQVGDHTFIPTPELRYILKMDFDYLSDPERRVMQAVLTQQSTVDILHPYLDGLTALGYLRQTNTGYQIGNDFFENWLLNLESQSWVEPSDISAEATLSLYTKPENFQLLYETFTDEELRCLCYDDPDFKAVYDQLTKETSKAEVINRLIRYAEKRSRLEDLLTLARKHGA
jgi:hypothetical protein